MIASLVLQSTRAHTIAIVPSPYSSAAAATYSSSSFGQQPRSVVVLVPVSGNKYIQNLLNKYCLGSNNTLLTLLILWHQNFVCPLPASTPSYGRILVVVVGGQEVILSVYPGSSNRMSSPCTSSVVSRKTGLGKE